MYCEHYSIVISIYFRNLWNHFETTHHRTTNSLESWHSNLKRSIQRSHPKNFLFVGALKKEQLYISVKVELALRNELSNTRSAKTIIKEQNISQLKAEYVSGSLTLLQYVDKLGKYTPRSLKK